MKSEQCGTCGRFKDTPNFAYHVCVKPRISGETIKLIYGAINSAIYFDKVSQYVKPEGSVVIMSAKKYRELIGEELPKTEIKGISSIAE